MDNPLSELEALPEELWLMIQRLTDRQSLATLVFTSRRCLNSFGLSRDEIWGRVCLDDMHRGVLFDALAVRNASDAFQHGHDMRVVLEFLEGSNSVEKPGGTEKYELRQSVKVQAQNVLWAELVPLHLIVSDLAAQIASEWCEVHPFDCLHPNGRKYLVGFRKPVGIDPLSLEELNRIYRALYRFELVCKLLPLRTLPFPGNLDQARVARFKPEDVRDLFFARFEAFEVEEIACIYDWLWKVYATAMDKYTAEELLPLERGPGGRLFYSTINYLMTLGLGFFYNLHIKLKSDGERVQLIKENLWQSNTSLAKAMDLQSFHSRYNSGDYQCYAGNDQPFSGDNISRPNKAWVWSTDGLYEFEYSRAKNIAMRSWGYVFWDQKRLYEWGVLEIRRELFQEDAAIYPPNCHCDPDSLGAPFPRVNPAGIHTCFIQSLKRAIE